MTMAMLGMAIVRVLALGLVMRIGVAIASVMTVAFVLGLVMTMALLLVREMALEIASAALAIALAMVTVMAARLLVPQSAASRRSRWIVSEVLKLEYALIPAPTSRRLYLH
jgi:hypothetical protein